MSDEKMTVEQALADLNKLADMLFHSGHTDHANNAAAIHKTLTAALADLKAERDALKLAVEGRDAEIEMYKALVQKVQSEREALLALLMRIRRDQSWRSNDNSLYPDIVKATAAREGVSREE